MAGEVGLVGAVFFLVLGVGISEPIILKIANKVNPQKLKVCLRQLDFEY